MTDGMSDRAGNTTEPEAAEGFRRIGTGSPQMDEILHGGFPANSINIIMGHPGTGKTIFVEQLIFHNAGGERPILFFTTLSEPLGKVVRYLQRFRFFDEEKLANAVVYDELGAELAEHGVGTLVPRLTKAIKSVSPKMIVIDSFKAVHDLASSLPDMRRMIANLAGLFTAYDTTVFLVGEYSAEQVPSYPEFAVADGVVELLRRDLGTRDERYIRVLKLRGSAYREGLHGMRITVDGVEVYPRLVSPEVPDGFEPAVERVPTGVHGLDAMLGGGIFRGRTTLVVGPTGSGKTTIGMQYVLQGIRDGEPSLYVNFQENPMQLVRLMRGLGVDVEQARRRGLHLMYTSPVELQIDSIIVEIFELIQKAGIRRVVVDAVGDLIAAASDPQRLHDYLYALVQQFAANGVTSLLTFEGLAQSVTAPGMDQARFSYMSDNLVALDMRVVDDRTRRTVRVVKARGSVQDLRVHEMEIGPDGVRIT